MPRGRRNTASGSSRLISAGSVDSASSTADVISVRWRRWEATRSCPAWPTKGGAWPVGSGEIRMIDVAGRRGRTGPVVDLGRRWDDDASLLLVARGRLGPPTRALLGLWGPFCPPEPAQAGHDERLGGVGEVDLLRRPSRAGRRTGVLGAHGPERGEQQASSL